MNIRMVPSLSLTLSLAVLMGIGTLIGCEQKKTGAGGNVKISAFDRLIENLKADDPARRTVAAKDLLKFPPTEVDAGKALAALKEAIKKETNPGAKAAMRDAIAAMKAR